MEYAIYEFIGELLQGSGLKPVYMGRKQKARWVLNPLFCIEA
ncbi:hypothetical protein Dtox_3391 [Desulfofarcimen acetoxidans DSM 771]|uniref:Uncharacterized protein n=1 Tax=Desulfofarcimen acetoxidans (strain ATCC 49208 / DSM 771 / KCTC 5769 / VKM B-1644 / 5575) TaxID=485916 RepID=C8W6L0_DESAS|nr:hypothetical protein Dtox_3391 [Desulfofarcimen acetoxidans DSM 771]